MRMVERWGLHEQADVRIAEEICTGVGGAWSEHVAAVERWARVGKIRLRKAGPTGRGGS